MGKRVLLAWEFGGGAGHLLQAARTAESLRNRGYEPVFALQRLDNVSIAGGALKGSELHQAPLWPGLGGPFGGPKTQPSVSLGDSLGALGLQAREAVGGIIEGWDRLFASTDPDAVVADFAPGCLMAARGRIPSVAVGDGFNLPPTQVETFPNLSPDNDPPLLDQVDTLTAVNDGLRASGREPLSRLPEIFAADRHCPGTFRELDPYASVRHEPQMAPWLPEWDHSVSAEGDEIFGYFSLKAAIQPIVFSALAEVARSGVRVRVFVLRLREEIASSLTAAGVMVERHPIPFEKIESRSALIVSYGSSSFVSCGLVAGIPQVVIPIDLAKNLTGRALEGLGASRCVRLQARNPFESSLLTQMLLETYNNAAMRDAARRLAPDFARRTEPRPQEAVADFIDELL